MSGSGRKGRWSAACHVARRLSTCFCSQRARTAVESRFNTQVAAGPLTGGPLGGGWHGSPNGCHSRFGLVCRIGFGGGWDLVLIICRVQIGGPSPWKFPLRPPLAPHRL